MIISRLTVRPDAPRDRVLRAATADTYGDHKALWALFSNESGRRPFLYRRQDRRGLPSFLLLSTEEPIDRVGLWTVEPKAFEPILRTGQTLRFALRANPVVSRRDENGRQLRHDVVMDARWKLREDGVSRSEWPSLPEIVQDECARWLARRATRLGFSLVEGSIACDGYRQHRLPRRGAQAARFSSVDIGGILVVENPEKLLSALRSGIGHAKAFGCGLLLVRPAGSR